MEMTDVQDLVGIEMLDIEILGIETLLLEDEHGVNATIEDHGEEPTMELEMVVDADVRFHEFLDRHKKIKDKDAHMNFECINRTFVEQVS